MRTKRLKVLATQLMFLPICAIASPITKDTSSPQIVCGSLAKEEAARSDRAFAKAFEISDIGSINILDHDQWHFQIPMGPATPEKIEEIERVVNFANKRFERRGWSEKFRGKRLRSARKFAERSAYFYTMNQTDITGSIGLTVAKYSSRDSILEILPMEDTPVDDTPGWKLDRPLTSNGKGIIFEMRTYGMDEDANGDPFRSLWPRTYLIMKRELSDYPELWDQEIVYTYGDDTSIRMYRLRGFRLADPSIHPPIQDEDGRVWHVLVSSPKKMLESFLSRIDYPLVVGGFKNPISFVTGTGDKFIADNASQIYLYGVKAPKSFTLFEHAEVKPGIWAGKGSKIAFYPSGKVEGISRLDTTTEVLPGLFVKQGSFIAFYENGTIRRINGVAREYPITTESGIQLSRELISHFGAIKDLRNRVELMVIEEGSRLIFDEEGKLTLYLGPGYRDYGLQEAIYARQQHDNRARK